MLNATLRGQIDKIWETFWTGGVTNPLTVIEQITYLLFMKQLDVIQQQKEKKAQLGRTKEIKDPIYTPEQNELRWSSFQTLGSPEELLKIFIRPDGAFEFIKQLGDNKDSAFTKYLKDATFKISNARVLGTVIDLISKIDMTDRDTKGDVYEYLLSKIAQAGVNGQFRTPRHIIKMMVALMAPKITDIICDPSAGSCGFLVVAAEYIREKYKQALAKEENHDHFQNGMFMGMEFDDTMLRIGAMNMMLHGIENVNLKPVDALSEANKDFVATSTLILANPPFKGSLDEDAVDSSIHQIVKGKKTELLFLALMLRGLVVGGRAAVIVPDGVLFGSSNAHKQIRKEILENNQLNAVISMPSGVFKPYAGVSTAVLIFTKTGKGGTRDVWFYDMEADGYSLDDKRTSLAPEFASFADLEKLIDQYQQEPVLQTDIPDIVHRYHNLEKERERARTEKSFMVPLSEIVANGYDLSINRYKEVVHEEIKYDMPQEIIGGVFDKSGNLQKPGIRQLDKERMDRLQKLEQLLMK
ncbi:class I SAM-dependent DNA methyltransferase [Chitinophaga sp. HK235]|uniref:type I restriction-modification system subunit M n=1 Tax=Chitinophaga sp. HK235 TaxID=2952571 RepID=UPI001BA4F6A7|nr:class I SAM-dependent DNA methyltransferase [Chitinophaga sp. HK235]